MSYRVLIILAPLLLVVYLKNILIDKCNLLSYVHDFLVFSNTNFESLL